PHAQASKVKHPDCSFEKGSVTKYAASCAGRANRLAAWFCRREAAEVHPRRCSCRTNAHYERCGGAGLHLGVRNLRAKPGTASVMWGGHPTCWLARPKTGEDGETSRCACGV